jgi:DNA-binding response OmpR family regulator
MRILIVDDDRDAAELLGEILTTYGYLTRIAFDADQALREAREFQPEAALLDLELDRMDGFELAAAMRTQPGGELTRFIAITGRSGAEVGGRLRDAGWAGHMVKPIDVADLCRRLAALAAPEEQSQPSK